MAGVLTSAHRLPCSGCFYSDKDRGEMAWVQGPRSSANREACPDSRTSAPRPTLLRELPGDAVSVAPADALGHCAAQRTGRGGRSSQATCACLAGSC